MRSSLSILETRSTIRTRWNAREFIPRVQPWVLAFYSQRSLGSHSVQNLKLCQVATTKDRLDTHEVVVTVGTVLIALVELRDIFPEGFLALLTDERHLRRLCKFVRLRFCVAFGTIEPPLATGRADGNLSIQDVLAIAL